MGDYIARLRCDGGAEQRISLPKRQVSSLTFGGDDYGDYDDIDDYGDIYITTAGGHRKNHRGVWPEGCFGFAAKFAACRNCSQLWDFIDLRTE
jgi:sugar lactone lactonase YvrE